MKRKCNYRKMGSDWVGYPNSPLDPEEYPYQAVLPYRESNTPCLYASKKPIQIEVLDLETLECRKPSTLRAFLLIEDRWTEMDLSGNKSPQSPLFLLFIDHEGLEYRVEQEPASIETEPDILIYLKENGKLYSRQVGLPEEEICEDLAPFSCCSERLAATTEGLLYFIFSKSEKEYVGRIRDKSIKKIRVDNSTRDPSLKILTDNGLLYHAAQKAQKARSVYNVESDSLVSLNSGLNNISDFWVQERYKIYPYSLIVLTADKKLYGSSSTTDPTWTQILPDQTWESASYYERGEFGYFAAINSLGQMYTAGDNLYGELGLGEDVYYNDWHQIGTEDQWKKIVLQDDQAGDNTVFAVKNDGTAWVIRKESGIPVPVFPDYSFSDIAISRHDYGSARIYGIDTSGKIVRGSTFPDGSMYVYANSPDYTSLYTFNGPGDAWIALCKNGQIVAYGQNTKGRFGGGWSQYSYLSCTSIGYKTWSKISVGKNHSAGIDTEGRLFTTGEGIYGQLGHGYYTSYITTFTQVTSYTDWVAVSCTDTCTYAIRSNGSVWYAGNCPIQGSSNYGLVPAGYPFNNAVSIITTSARDEYGTHPVIYIRTAEGNELIVENGVRYVGPVSSERKYESGEGMKWMIDSGRLFFMGDATQNISGQKYTSSRTSLLRTGTDSDWLRAYACEDGITGIKKNGTAWAAGKRLLPYDSVDVDSELKRSSSSAFIQIPLFGENEERGRAIACGSTTRRSIITDKGELWGTSNSHYPAVFPADVELLIEDIATHRLYHEASNNILIISSVNVDRQQKELIPWRQRNRKVHSTKRAIPVGPDSPVFLKFGSFDNFCLFMFLEGGEKTLYYVGRPYLVGLPFDLTETIQKIEDIECEDFFIYDNACVFLGRNNVALLSVNPEEDSAWQRVMIDSLNVAIGNATRPIELATIPNFPAVVWKSIRVNTLGSIILLGTQGELYRGGQNRYSSLGNQAPEAQLITRWVDVPDNIVEIAMDWNTTYALDALGVVHICGRDNPEWRTYDVLSGPVASISSAGRNSCCVLENGDLYCWGEAPYIGLPFSDIVEDPIMIKDGIKEAFCGSEFIVALTKTGEIWAAGRNTEGEMGQGGAGSYSEWTQVGNDNDWASVYCSPNGRSVFATKNDGTTWFWGLWGKQHR